MVSTANGSIDDFMLSTVDRDIDNLLSMLHAADGSIDDLLANAIFCWWEHWWLTSQCYLLLMGTLMTFISTAVGHCCCADRGLIRSSIGVLLACHQIKFNEKGTTEINTDQAS